MICDHEREANRTMPNLSPAPLEYYATPGEVTDIGAHRAFVDWMADDVSAAFRVVQGLVIHDGWMPAYGVRFNDAQRYDFATLRMDAILRKALELSPVSLAIPRAPERRVIGCCRDFATLMTAILRANMVPDFPING